MLVILFLNHVYYTSHLDIVSYPLEALCGMIITLPIASVYFFVDGVPMFVFTTWINQWVHYFNFYFLVLQAYVPLG